MKYVWGIVVISLLTGCATARKINRVQVGMTKSQVIEVMGKPTSISAKSGTEYLNYNLSETGDDAFLGNTSHYFVRLINGTVDAYGRAGDFDSTKTPTIKIEKDESVKLKSDKDMYTELKKLSELRKEGTITEAEFQKEKAEILEKY